MMIVETQKNDFRLICHQIKNELMLSLEHLNKSNAFVRYLNKTKV